MTPLGALPLATAALLSGLGLCLTHAYLPGLGMLAPIPLLWVLRRSSPRAAFYAGLLCGVCEAFVLCGMWHAQLALVVVLCLFYGLQRALFAVLARLLTGTPLTAPGVAAVWILVERLQSAVPYSLPTLLGDTQHVGPFLPLARLGGTYAVSCMLLWLAGCGTDLLEALFRPERRRPSAWIGTVVALLAWAGLRLEAAACVPPTTGQAEVSLVQGGLPTWFYTRSETEARWAGLPEAVYETLTTQAPPAALTIWPETSVWRTWGTDKAFMQDLQHLQELRGALLVGLPRQDAGADLYNSAILLQPTGVSHVDKRRLALRAEAQFTPGDALALLPWRDGPLGIVFCLESVVPDYARELTLQGAVALVVLAEGSRFGNTPVARLHAQRSVLRAVETGRTVVHAGQQGYSAIISPSGAHLPALPAYAASVMHDSMTYATALTPYVHYGDWTLLPEVLALAVAACWAWLPRKN